MCTDPVVQVTCPTVVELTGVEDALNGKLARPEGTVRDVTDNVRFDKSFVRYTFRPAVGAGAARWTTPDEIWPP
jgi:hypothetical protein